VKRLTGLILAAILSACGGAEPEVAKEAQVRMTQVAVAHPRLRDIEEVLTALGSVESINDPTISAETSGQVQQILVREGDTVGIGQLLAALDSTLHGIESAKAEAELRRYRVLVQNQDNEVKRLQRLDETQSVSQDKLEDEQAQLEMLEAQRDIADKQWERYQYLQSKTRITAPLAGLVTRRHISPGDYVSAGQPLFEMVSVDRLRVRVAFPEHDASRIAVGKPVYLKTPAAPGVVARGEVTAVNPQIKTHNRAVEINVEFENPGSWLPGGSADATLVVEQRKQALTVPRLAVVTRNGREVVLVVENEQVRSVAIDTGWREDGWVEVFGALKPSDWIVVDGAGLITDGSRVTMEKPSL
jgi:membrane fusion protein (multidrug efflux system)